MEQQQKQKTEHEAKVIRCHPELMEILESLRQRLGDVTYGVLLEKASYYDLTGILAKKIKGRV